MDLKVHLCFANVKIAFLFMVEYMCIYTHTPTHTSVYVTFIYTCIPQRTLDSLKEFPVLIFFFFLNPMEGDRSQQSMITK